MDDLERAAEAAGIDPAALRTLAESAAALVVDLRRLTLESIAASALADELLDVMARIDDEVVNQLLRDAGLTELAELRSLLEQATSTNSAGAIWASKRGVSLN